MTEESPTAKPFADRLNYLFETVHPAERKPYSNPEVAKAINGAAGEDVISGAYLWLLRSGKRDNPTKRHIEALAKFFGVPGSYFLDDAAAEELTEQLEFLRAARDAQVRELAMRTVRLSPKDRASMLRIMRSLDQAPDDDEASDAGPGTAAE
jgi:transcriptional regulator with XRE-family HTH domain